MINQLDATRPLQTICHFIDPLGMRFMYFLGFGFVLALVILSCSTTQSFLFFAILYLSLIPGISIHQENDGNDVEAPQSQQPITRDSGRWSSASSTCHTCAAWWLRTTKKGQRRKRRQRLFSRLGVAPAGSSCQEAYRCRPAPAAEGKNAT